MAQISRYVLMTSIGLGLCTLVQNASAATYDVLATFGDKGTGSQPSGLLLNKSGVMFGTTFYGGNTGGVPGAPRDGTVFKIPRSAARIDTLYTFRGGADSSHPNSAGLVSDPSHTLYGVTAGSGLSSGTIFKIDPATHVLTTLHVFNGTDGSYPLGPLLRDKAGMLYGVTSYGGASPCHCGTVYKFDPASGTLTTLHAFSGGTDGYQPSAAVVMDPQRDALYGTTFGTTGSPAIVFKADLASGTTTSLHVFDKPQNGGTSLRGVVIGPKGRIFGTTSAGGDITTCQPFAMGCGSLYRLDPETGDFVVLHNFSGADGRSPDSTLALDSAGAMYGVTNEGGGPFDAGVVFKYDPSSSVFTVLHSFTEGTQGGFPFYAPVIDSTGTVYGTANGGSLASGIVYRITQ